MGKGVRVALSIWAQHVSRIIILALSLLFFLQNTALLADEKVIYTIDFTGQRNGSAIPWLQDKGFVFELDANKLNPRFENDALVISADNQVAGLFGLKFEPNEFIHGAKRARIIWGVNKYPEGANWENGVNSVPIAVMFSFGTKKLSSGLPLGIKAVPYFLSAFIGEKEGLGKMYIGRLWKQGGRYFCVATGGQSGNVITTDFEFDRRFKRVFKQKKTPPITAFAFQKNTVNTVGVSEAFIRKIIFLSE